MTIPCVCVYESDAGCISVFVLERDGSVSSASRSYIPANAALDYVDAMRGRSLTEAYVWCDECEGTPAEALAWCETHDRAIACSLWRWWDGRPEGVALEWCRDAGRAFADVVHGLLHPGWRRVWRALSAESAAEVAAYIRLRARTRALHGRAHGRVAHYLERVFLSDVRGGDIYAPCVARDLRAAGLMMGGD